MDQHKATYNAAFFGSRPFIRKFYEAPMSGEEIEAESLRIIDLEAPPHHFTDDQWHVVRRMIHTTGDFGLAEAVRFSDGAVEAGIKALKAGRPLYTDSNMIRSGISLLRLRQVFREYNEESVICHVSDPEVVLSAQKTRLPRSLHAVRKARSILDGGIAIFGNAPIALLELNRMIIEEELKPALVVGMPVGFVHVIESKEELMSTSVPFITLAGRRGGSPLAVSVIHALCVLAGARGTG